MKAAHSSRRNGQKGPATASWFKNTPPGRKVGNLVLVFHFSTALFAFFHPQRVSTERRAHQRPGGNSKGTVLKIRGSRDVHSPK
jgi:hypothetical protein